MVGRRRRFREGLEEGRENKKGEGLRTDSALKVSEKNGKLFSKPAKR